VSDAPHPQRVTVMGLGLFGGGVAAARHFARRGARVTVTDLRGPAELARALEQLEGLDLRLVLGEHRQADFEEAQLVVANPAVRPDNPFLEQARRAGARVTSEVALFLDACPAEVVAISGTQGKSSTCHLLSQLLEQGERRVHLGGNIGRPLLDQLETIGADDLCVLELSSYQLESLPEAWTRGRPGSPVVAAALVNVLEDHLERHGDRAAYARAKLRMAELVRPGGLLVLPEDPLPVPFEAPTDLRVERRGPGGLRVEGGHFRAGDVELGPASAVPWTAPFQLDNVALAAGLALRVGLAPEALRAGLSTLRGLPHRLDPVGHLGDRMLWDNGVSTTPDTTLSALEALEAGVVLLVGGQPKELGLEPLIRACRAREARVVVFGAAAEPWSEAFRGEGVPTETAAGPREALDQALELEGNALLFSPACASFDAYPNFRARAEELLDHARSLGITPLEVTRKRATGHE